jgi:hypothetical protein
MTVIVDSGMLGVPLHATCTTCGERWVAPDERIRQSYDRFYHAHQHQPPDTPAA